MSDEGRLVAGRYRLAERIGRGGMGTVWRADDELLGRQVALKQLHERPHLSADELGTLYERMRREARSAARVTHPNVIVVHDVVEDDGRPCVVMEYVPGRTLGDLLQGGRTLPPHEAARVGLAMVGALRAAHEAGVLHRDVKPGNVLLGAGDRVVLTDFGIAMTAGSSTLTRTGEMVGSIEYMAPERVRGLTPGPASDLWALGATLYQALEGRPPFRRATAMETAYAIATDLLTPPSRSGPLAPLIESLLAREPEARPSAEETERALRTVAITAPKGRGAVPTGGSAAGRDQPRTTRIRRRRRITTIAAALTATLAVGTTLYTTAPHHTAEPDHDTARPAPVPKGYHLVHEPKLGVSFPIPNDWTPRDRTAEQVIYATPSGLAGITIGTVAPAGPTPADHFTEIEANTKVNYPTYRRIRMQRTTFREQPAAIWEFTFQGRARPFRAIDLGYGREGGREYDIYLSAPEAQWDTYRPVFDQVRNGFRTGRA
ncbi:MULTISPECIES: serine/threonine-protein kinase [Streptomyces]|uniref:non-specific serine/threonine protein kinase n=1 Tax=Streptomyces chartreusis NRRL 3882 TaxID=1079985 RepID=A0A2N9B529_STRCX|nr:serine/threonine-protein kinase [Streptomyces chartreusis]SOR78441.1 Serine/threonine-protein kinase PrkC [Streptomyces chartreusis NRRL 3882]